MVREIFYNVFLIIKRLTNVKFIIVGDFKQLSPVNDRVNENTDYRNSLALKQLCDYNKLQLTICRRSNPELFNLFHKGVGQ